MKRGLKVLLLVAALLLWWNGTAKVAAHTEPLEVPREISPILAHTPLSQSDCDLLLRQTGLGPAGVRAVLARGGPAEVLRFQRQYFAAARWRCRPGTPLTRQDLLDAPVQMAPLEDGDVLVTPAAHCLGWRIGHAALVTSAASDSVLEFSIDGLQQGRASAFAGRAAFLVLRLKGASAAQRAHIAAFRCPAGTRYSLFARARLPAAGAVPASNCSHLVWCAFAASGWDIAPGGGIVSPRDIAVSGAFEVVQAYGVRLPERWN